MSSPRKHLARRSYGQDGLAITCHCGQYEPVTGTVREQEDAHRAHRTAMGETVKPRQPTRLERAETAIAAVQQLLDEHPDTIPAARIREALDGQ